MAKAATRVCAVPGCPTITTSSKCDVHHTRKPNRSDIPAAQRGYDARWQKIRRRYLAQHPRCIDCGIKATLVDHIVPLQAGGTHSDANLQPMCASCHARKTVRHDGGYGRPTTPQGDPLPGQ